MKIVWTIAFLLALVAISFSISSQDLYDPKFSGDYNNRLMSAIRGGSLDKECIRYCTEYLKKNCDKCLKREQDCIECDTDRQKCKQSQKDLCRNCQVIGLDDCKRCINEGVKCLIYDNSISELLNDFGADINYPAGCWAGDTPLIEAINVSDYSTYRSAIVEQIGHTIIMADNVRRLPQSEINALLAKGGVITKRVVRIMDSKEDNERREKVIRFLLDKKADPNSTSCFFGVGSLMTAVRKSDLTVVRWLLDAGADPNGNICRKNKGWNDFCYRLDKTPLMEAADKGDTPIVKLLLASGADPLLKDREGNTARDWAKSNNHQEIVEILK